MILSSNIKKSKINLYCPVLSFKSCSCCKRVTQIGNGVKTKFNSILTHRGQNSSGKVHKHSQDRLNLKKTYVVDCYCTDCVHGVIDLLDNEFELFKSTRPHCCKHRPNIFDAKLFAGKVTKTHTRILIDPAKLAIPASSVYSSIPTKIEKKMEKRIASL